MADKKKPDNLEMERIKLERYKVNRIVGTVLIIALFVCVLIACLNYMHPNRELGEKILEGKINTEQHQVLLEIEKNKLERFKVWGKIIIAIITVLFGSGLGTYINYSIQSRQLKQQEFVSMSEIKQQELVNNANVQQAEMENLGKFLDHALKEEVNERIRFATYFAKVTIDEKARGRWGKYLETLETLQTDAKKLKEELIVAREAGDSQHARVKELETKLTNLQAQIEPLPKKSKFEIACEKVGLNENGRPLKYTVSEYELKSDGQVVYDKTTELTWQQSGYDRYMNFEDAKTYIKKLNSDKVAGYSDWRLPTLEEATTLLEQKRKSNDLFIDRVLDKKQKWIWRSDKSSASVAWVVYFNDGYCYYDYFDFNLYVRAVR